MEVLVIDDRPITIEVLRVVIASAFQGTVVHVAGDMETGLKLARDVPEDTLVLLDLLLPGYRDIQALSHFLSNFPHLRVVVVSAIQEPKIVRLALEAGAAGYIPKTMRAKTMVAALQLIASGAVYMPAELFIITSRELLSPREANAKTARASTLTKGELRILRLLCAGYKNKEIAKQLSISAGTVKQHVHRIYGKLDTSTRSEAVVAAIRNGLISEAPGGTSKSAA